MDIKINVYLTTRKDPVPDLDETKDLTGLLSWTADVRRHALKILEDEKLDQILIDHLKGYTIEECYAVITHHPEKSVEAVHLGNFLKVFLKQNSGQLKWDLKETGASAVNVSKILKENPHINPELLWDNFSFGLIADPQHKQDEYRAYVEFVVR